MNLLIHVSGIGAGAAGEVRISLSVVTSGGHILGCDVALLFGDSNATVRTKVVTAVQNALRDTYGIQPAQITNTRVIGAFA